MLNVLGCVSTFWDRVFVLYMMMYRGVHAKWCNVLSWEKLIHYKHSLVTLSVQDIGALSYAAQVTHCLPDVVNE